MRRRDLEPTARRGGRHVSRLPDADEGHRRESTPSRPCSVYNTGGTSSVRGGTSFATGGVSPTDGAVGGARGAGGVTGGDSAKGGFSGGGRAGGLADAGAGGGGTGPSPDTGSVDPSRKITVWMVGNSTMRNCGGSVGQCGWGTLFQPRFGPNATVSNQARGGRSISTWIWGDPNVSKTATDASGECQIIENKTYSTNWTTMLDFATGMKAVDWVFIELGISDAGGACDRHVGRALFQSDLIYLAKAIRDKGANPIFTEGSSQKLGPTDVPRCVLGCLSWPAWRLGRRLRACPCPSYRRPGS